MKKSSLSLLTSLLLTPVLFASSLSKEIQNNSLVVYNSNIGLVHEERQLSIKPTESTIVYEGVAKTLHTDSINVSLPDAVTLLSQQYRFDKLTQTKLLESHIDKKVEVRMLKNRNEFKIIPVTLLSFSGTNALVRTTDFQVISVASKSIIFSDIPDELITKPSLVWNVKVQSDTNEKMKLDYLISNINFKSDYILNLDSEDKATLTGWINVENRSGKRFEDVTLSLLAGDVNRVSQNRPRYQKERVLTVMSDAPEVREIAHEGYHIYKIPFKVNLANNEKTQIKFLTKKSISIKRENIARLSNPLYSDAMRKYGVVMYVTLSPLGVPLPQGVIRSYSKLENSTLFLGENRVPHTSKNTPLKVKIGKNFDIHIKQKVIRRDNNQKYYNVDLEYSVQNDSDFTKEITLKIPFNRNHNSKITTTQKYSFTEGNLVTFTLLVPANSTKIFQVNYESKK